MRSKNTELMNRIVLYVNQFYLDNQKSPSTTLIAAAVGISRGTAYKYLVAMAEKGLIEYNGTAIRTSITKKCSNGHASAAIVGSVICGSPQEEQEQIEEYVSLPESIFGKGEFYILRAKGDSMVDAGIDEGDLVVIRKQPTAEIGEIVVALTEDCENTLKKLGKTNTDDGTVLLNYCNEQSYPHRTIRVKLNAIQGVAKNVIKSL